MTRRVREQRTKEFMEIGAQAEGKPFKSPGEYPRGPRLLFVPVAFAVVRLDVWMQQRLILSLGITHKHGGQLASLGHLFKVRHPVQRFGNIRAERIKHLRLFAPHRHALRDIGKCVGYSERAIPQSISEREWPDRHAYGHCGGRWQLRERQLLSPRRRLHQRGYWDVDWNKDIRQWHFLRRAGNPWIHAGRTDDAASG